MLSDGILYFAKDENAVLLSRFASIHYFTSVLFLFFLFILHRVYIENVSFIRLHIPLLHTLTEAIGQVQES